MFLKNLNFALSTLAKEEISQISWVEHLKEN
jgi:hypothetical protein